jgi:hypothetical protein
MNGDDLDTLVRTVYGEARGEPSEGQRAVAAVALNRARATGQPLSSVVTAPGQFESWDTAATRGAMTSLSPNDPQYKKIAAAVAPLLDGSAPDPTSGADHFYAPKAQAALGRPKPAWDNGTGQPIGGHLFFKSANGTSPDDALDGIIAGRAPAASGASDLDAALNGGSPDQSLDAAISARRSPPQGGPSVDLDAALAPSALVPSSSDFQAGVNAAFRKGGKPAVLQFYADQGRDPSSVQGQDAAFDYYAKHPNATIPVVEMGQTPAGPGAAAPSLTAAPPLHPSDSMLTNSGQGIRQGFEDAGSTGQQISKWVDDRVPALAALDRKSTDVGVLSGMPDNQLARYAVDRSVYDKTAGKTWAGSIGRLAGNVIGTAPLMAIGGGAIGAGAEALGVAPEATGFLGGTAGRSVAGNALTGAEAVPGNLLMRGASLSANGGIQGGTAAAMTSGGRDEPVGTQIAQGVIGGAALAPAASVVSSVANKLKVLASPITSVARGIGEQFSKPADVASNRLVQRMTQDANVGGPTVADMRASAASAPGKPLTIMDVGGENVRGLAGRVARSPGEGRAMITDALAERDQGAGGRVSQDIRDGVSSGGSSHDTAQSLMQARAAAAKPLYEAAYASPPVSSPKLDAILNTPAGKQALGKAMTIAANEGRDPKAMGFVLDQHGNVSLDPTIHMGDDGSLSQSPLKQKGYSTQTLDYVKRGMDDIIEADRDKVTGVLHPTPLTSSVQTVKNGLLAEMDKVNPAYKAARAAYSGPSTSMDAMSRGRQILNQRPEANRDFIAKLSDGDKEFFKQGAADALLEKIARTSAGGDESKRIIGNDYVQQQLRPLFDTQGAFDKFIGNIQAEARMYATRQSVLGGSQTGGRVAEDASPASQAALKGVRSVASAAAGHWGGALRNIVEAAGHMADRRDPATNAAVANLLTTPIRPGSASTNFLQRVTEPTPAPSVLSGYAAGQAAPHAGNRLLSVMNDNYASLAASPVSGNKKKRQPGR